MSLRYSIVAFVSVIAWNVDAQTSPNNQAIVTIIGDPVQSVSEEFNSNPYAENNESPPSKQQINQSNKTIEPTLDNGFHMRFEIGSEDYINHGGTTSYSVTASTASGISYSSKAKKRSISMAERSFNVKKRFKSWMPERKKKYRPHLCGRF